MTYKKRLQVKPTFDASNWRRIYQSIFLFAIALILFAVDGEAKELSLYNKTGEAVAYIDTSKDLTIYSWEGKPVAYLSDDSVYGFNGKHLGWFEDGIVRNHKGCGVGFIEGAVSKLTKLEGLKGLCPLRSLKSLEPLKPMYKDRWSAVQLELFLSRGAK